MKKIILATLIAATPMISSASDLFSNGNGYLGVGFGGMVTKVDFGGYAYIKSKNTVGFLKAGYNLTDNIATEIRLGGSNSSTAPLLTGTLGDKLSFKINSYVSYLARFRTPEIDGARLYFLAGITSARGTLSATVLGSPYSSSATTSGFSYGGGYEWDFADNLGVSIEYVSYLRNNRLDSSTVVDSKGGNLSLDYRF